MRNKQEELGRPRWGSVLYLPHHPLYFPDVFTDLWSIVVWVSCTFLFLGITLFLEICTISRFWRNTSLIPDFPFSGHFSEFRSVSICRSSCHLFPAFGFGILHGTHGHCHGATPWLKSLLISSWKGASSSFTAEGIAVESGDLQQLREEVMFCFVF